MAEPDRGWLRIVGKTEAGGAVYAGAYRTHESTGVRLESLVHAISQTGGVTCVVNFVAEAMQAGMHRDGAIRNLGEAISDVLGQSRRAETRRRYLTLLDDPVGGGR